MWRHKINKITMNNKNAPSREIYDDCQMFGWYRWENWLDTKDANTSGIFIISIFSKGQQGHKLDALSDDVVYIGRTNSSSPQISTNLKSFQHNILCGGFDMHNIFNIKNKLHALYAMIIPVEYNNPIYLDAKLDYVEASLKWDFINNNKHLSVLNENIV